MGVPAFFRWLSRKYPSIVAHCVEEKPRVVDGVKIPVDSSQPNPNNVEFDNLYLDMNGIIHPCCHPEDKPAPKNEDEMMVLIFEYIDRLFSIVRPRRLLYMAIDGVAPRAKMNQQRSRRFRASKEVSEKVEEISKIRGELESKGIELPPEKPKGEHFDSNCITPGTPFMDRLAKCLHYYIHERLNTDPGWKGITVILSDANVPGEGEHKIMDYIRKQRGNPDHDPNTRHCLCGADADLIMLGLATHEPNFTIIREEFKPNQPRPCEICGQIGHEMKECAGGAREKQGDCDELPETFSSEQEFIFLRLNVLREYLEKELNITTLPFPFDLERAIDDWVFMCFFVGNDFLPHLPSLEIREGAIDKLVALYKQLVNKTKDYLTDSGMVSMEKVQVILAGLGEVEDEVFKRRQEREVFFKNRDKEKKRRMKMTSGPAFQLKGQFAPVPVGSSPGAVRGARHEAYMIRTQPASFSASQDNRRAATDLKAALRSPDGASNKRTASEAGLDDDDSEEEAVDEVRLWEEGWKERYYESKFEVDKDDYAFRHKVACEYTLGLCWVLQYYYQGCPSWKWFFPYHYAPFASDFINIGGVATTFEKGTCPFNPLEQLMGVFPAASKQHLPVPWGELMADPESPIIDFYPDDFTVDLNGKKFAWQGVALLPFVDEKRLLSALEDVYPLLTKDEKRRNERGCDKLFVGRCHPAYTFLSSLYEGTRDHEQRFDVDTSLTYGVGGAVQLSREVVEPGGVVVSPVPGCEDFHDNRVICVGYHDPSYEEGHLFPARRLPGAKEPLRVLKPSDLTPHQSRNWRPTVGMAPSEQRASVDVAGMRMLRHGLQAQGFNTVPPPPEYGYGFGRGNFRSRSEPYNAGDGRHHRYYNDHRGGSGYRGGGGGGSYRGNQPHWQGQQQFYQRNDRQQHQDRPQRFPPPPPRSDYQNRQSNYRNY